MQTAMEPASCVSSSSSGKKKVILCHFGCSETFEDLTNSNLNLINRNSKDRKSITGTYKDLKILFQTQILSILLLYYSYFVDFLVLLCVSSHLQGGCCSSRHQINAQNIEKGRQGGLYEILLLHLSLLQGFHRNSPNRFLFMFHCPKKVSVFVFFSLILVVNFGYTEPFCRCLLVSELGGGKGVDIQAYNWSSVFKSEVNMVSCWILSLQESWKVLTGFHP